MGVIARVLGQPQMVYYVKGAPEKVIKNILTNWINLLTLSTILRSFLFLLDIF